MSRKGELPAWVWWGAGLGLVALIFGGKAVMEYEKAKPFLPLINAASQKWGVPAALLTAQLHQESDFDPNARSPVGALGIAQFMPATAAQFGIDPLDPAQAINAQAQYMAELYHEFGSWPLALVAYNWGPGHVSRLLNQTSNWFAALPAETSQYVTNITSAAGIQLA